MGVKKRLTMSQRLSAASAQKLMLEFHFETMKREPTASEVQALADARDHYDHLLFNCTMVLLENSPALNHLNDEVVEED